jgi:hypothetical protein
MLAWSPWVGRAEGRSRLRGNEGEGLEQLSPLLRHEEKLERREEGGE